MMESAINTSCLSFFTANHARHDKQWLQKGSQLSLVCFACFVEIIESKNEPSVRKTRTLQELLNLISRGDLLQILSRNEAVLSHLVNCLWELTDFDENNRAQSITVIEILYQLCCSLQSQVLVEKVVHSLAHKLVTSKNIKQVSPHLDLLGKLVQKIPGLATNLLQSRMNLVVHIAKNTSFPDEVIRSSLFFILTHLYRDGAFTSSVSDEIKELIFRECSEVLATAATKELQINSVALLESLTKPENLARNSKMIAPSMDQVQTSLKKAFLSRIELVQSLAVGCLNNLVLFDEQVINSDLTGFLFEIFKTRNDALLAHGFQSVSQLVEKKSLYNKGHVSYGFETVVSALLVIIENRNAKLIDQGFGILAKILGNCPLELSLISSKSVVSKCLDVFTGGLSSPDDSVVLQACQAFSVFLERRHFGCDVPYSRLAVLFQSLVGRLEKICQSTGPRSRVENKDLKVSLIAAILEAIDKALDLALCSQAQAPTLESLLVFSGDETSTKELDHFVNKILQLCDQSYIPSVITNLQKLQGTRVPEKFFKILKNLLCICPIQTQEMCRKFVASCFIRIALDTKAQNYGKSSYSAIQAAVNSFLEMLCCRLVAADMRDDVKFLFRSCLNKLNGTAQDLLQILKQNNLTDDALENTQECILVLFYLAYQGGDRLVPRPQLLHALSTFLVLNPRCYEHSRVIPKYLTQLYIIELYRSSGREDDSPLYRKAKTILAESISKSVKNVNVLYFHDIALVEWIVERQDMIPELRKEVLELWFSHVGEDDIGAEQAKWWDEMVDRYPRTLLLLSTVLETSEVHAQNAILCVLHSVLSVRAEREAFKETLKELKVALLDVFLNQAVEPLVDRNIESLLKLLCLLLTSSSRKPLDGNFMKLVYHVVNLLMKPCSSHRVRTGCLNFLNASIVQDTACGSDQVLSFLLNHHDFNTFLQTVIHSHQGRTAQLERSEISATLAAGLLAVSYLIRLQKVVGITSENVIEVSIETALSLLCYISSALVQFAANVFWEIVLQYDDPFTTNLSLQTDSQAPPLTEKKGLRKFHLKMILIRLQNSILQPNPLTQLSALRCLDALLSLEETAEGLLLDPWNRALLREVKDFDTSDGSFPFCLQLYSVFLRHKRRRGLNLDFSVSDLVREVLVRFEDNEGSQTSDQQKSHAIYAKFLCEALQCKPDLMTTQEKSNLRGRVKHQISSHHDNGVPKKVDASFVDIQGLLVHEDLIQGKPEDPLEILNKLLDLLK